MRTPAVLRALRCTAAVGASICIVLVSTRVRHVNHTTVALLLVLLILGISTRWGSLEALAASLAGGLGFNYFFLPPSGLGLEAPERWVTLGAFMLTAIVTGQLSARAYSGQQTVATDTVETTGAAANIQLSPERTTLQANAEDAVVVPVSILDDKGRVVPDAANRVTFALSGAGEILGVSNGNPADHDTDKSNKRNSFHGHCMVVIEAGSQPGVIQLTASSPGLTAASVTFDVSGR